MKRKSVILIATTVTLLLVLAFAGGSASALGCFTDTNGHWAEAFICWMYDNGLSSGYPGGIFLPNNAISRAEVAVLLQKMRTTGDFSFNQGPGNWVVNGAGAESVTHYTSVDRLTAPASPGTYYFQSAITIPSNMYHTRMFLTGAKICYDATSGGVLDYIQFQHRLSSGYLWASLADDNTNRSDSACRTYTFSTPPSFYGGEFLSVFLTMTADVANEYVDIYSVTVYLAPSATGDAPILKEADREGLVPNTPNSGEAP